MTFLINIKPYPACTTIASKQSTHLHIYLCVAALAQQPLSATITLQVVLVPGGLIYSSHVKLESLLESSVQSTQNFVKQRKIKCSNMTVAVVKQNLQKATAMKILTETLF